jgi:rSAM/selenodomain-associated transferase 1
VDGPAVTALLVLAKAPVSGRSKTRLCPPCTSEEAARLAEAALSDTLVTVAATTVRRKVLMLDGDPGPWLPPGFEVIPQRGRRLDERLASSFEDVGPGVLIGMDTPQVTAALLERCVERLAEPEVDAVIGPAEDGGYWASGLGVPDRAVFVGVPMSVAETGAVQRRRLARLGLRTAELPTLRDVDRIEDARAVASAIPGSRFALALSEAGVDLAGTVVG